MQRLWLPLLNQPPWSATSEHTTDHFQVVTVHSTSTALYNFTTSQLLAAPIAARVKTQLPTPHLTSDSSMTWSAPILEESRVVQAHPLLEIHLESHTARFRSCTMAMIDVASAPHAKATSKLLRVRESSSSRSMYFVHNQSPAAARQSAYCYSCQRVITLFQRPGSREHIGKSRPDSEA